MTNKETLIKARALIKKGWTQKYYAKDKDGNHLEIPFDGGEPEGATCYCTLGAIFAAAGWGYRGQDCKILIRKIIDGSITEWNDHPSRTKAEVLSLFDRAIQEA